MFSDLLLNLILQHISLLAFILRWTVAVKLNLDLRTIINNSTSDKVKLSVQITTVLEELSQYPSPIIQCAIPIVVSKSPIFNGTIFINLFFSLFNIYHWLCSTVNAGKDLLAYWVGVLPVTIGLGQGRKGVVVQIGE